jgi:hypothetical protein
MIIGILFTLAFVIGFAGVSLSFYIKHFYGEL